MCVSKLYVEKLCVSKLCVGRRRAAGGGRREEAGRSAQPKTKNPTQRCGEQVNKSVCFLGWCIVLLWNSLGEGFGVFLCLYLQVRFDPDAKLFVFVFSL